MKPRELLAERQALYEQMRPYGLTPLWEVLHALVPPEPGVRTAAAHWRWQDVQPFLEEPAGSSAPKKRSAAC